MLGVLGVGHLGLVGPKGSDGDSGDTDEEAAGSDMPSLRCTLNVVRAYEIFLHKSVVSVTVVSLPSSLHLDGSSLPRTHRQRVA